MKGRRGELRREGMPARLLRGGKRGNEPLQGIARWRSGRKGGGRGRDFTGIDLLFSILYSSNYCFDFVSCG
jgi:hypothetical protein